MALPYPHRATFLASTLVVPVELVAAKPYLARLLSLILFDHCIGHHIVTLGDHDDERLTDEDGRLLDAQHPMIEDSIDWFFRVSRRHEVLWFELSFDPARPAPAVLRSRRPDRPTETWSSTTGAMLSHQMEQCLANWFASRRLSQIGPLPEFSTEDLRLAAQQLSRADAQLSQGVGFSSLPTALAKPPARLGVAYLRVLAELSRDDARAIDPVILALDPSHPVARRNRYVAGVLNGTVDRRTVLPLVEEAPMYAKPHLSIWGDSFAADRPHENMGVRHQGIATSLMPANPYACHNYSLQLAEVGRREESFRWADRATVVAPHFATAHLDCIRRLRQVQRPGQAFAEAQYRCREVLDRAQSAKQTGTDWQAPHHAALLLAFAHLDIGRLPEAITLADEAMAQLPNDPAKREAFAWATKRIHHWKTDAALFSRAFAWEGHYRGDPGRVISGLMRGRITDEEDAAMLIDALVAIGRPEQAELAYWHCAGLDGQGVLGDGKARLAAAKALILTGDLDEALDQIQIVQLRRGQGRHEADINRTLRLAATRDAREWNQVLQRRLERGAMRLAQRAARDLADFIPGVDAALVNRAVGERPAMTIDPAWITDLAAALAAAGSTATAIIHRLARPEHNTLTTADQLAQEWWTVLASSNKDGDAHAAGALLALGIAMARYFEATSGPPTPIAGAYRQIATEALQLVRRSRYQLEPEAIEGLLRLIDRLNQAPEWLLDTWLLRIERALDLEAEHGSYLEAMVAELPTVRRLLRGDERIGWELRLAHDLCADPSQYEPAATLFVRAARAVEGGSVPLAWSAAASAAKASIETQLDVHWLAAVANPGVPAPWLRLARGLLAAGRLADGFAAACRGIAMTPVAERAAALDKLMPRWSSSSLSTPYSGDEAYDAGMAAASEGRFDVAVQHLRWAAAVDPDDALRTTNLAMVLAKLGYGLEAIRALSRHERADAPKIVGRALFDAGHNDDALTVLRYASRRFRTAEDWALLSQAAHRADNDSVAVTAGRRAFALGCQDVDLLVSLATGLYRMGEFIECERLAHQLIADGANRNVKVVGLHAMARALAGQGRHVDAHRYAKAASELGPNGVLAKELVETMEQIVAQAAPPTRPSIEMSMERQAFSDYEAGKFETLVSAITSPSWSIARVALAACEFRSLDENGVPVTARALEAAIALLGRSEGTTDPEATLARIRALRIRDNAYIQTDPPPPLGARYSAEEFERGFAERARRPRSPSAVMSFSR
ncbi:MAG: hypothetical protein AB7O24_02305 [Kofleriaceae bacterium]